MQRNLDQAEVTISIAKYAMASQAAKLCRVCMAFLIVLMASDLLFASHAVAKPATLQTMEDKLTQAA